MDLIEFEELVNKSISDKYGIPEDILEHPHPFDVRESMNIDLYYHIINSIKFKHQKNEKNV